MWWQVLLLIGLIVIGFGIRETALQRRLLREGIRTEGLVVRHRRHRVQKGDVFFAVVNFVDAQGISHEFEAKVSGVKGLPVGGQAPVLYLLGAPKTARVDDSRKRLESMGLPLVFGTVFTAAAIWMLYTGR
ncbi:DUF3592 domain-containing protein [Streptomyces ureilyticus]|uniref:DUF3592 domain-containing protein n=1 Tax=Streptomyces ureilyticus TaxID=1775131 RepID=A0ABX0DVR5_9ACTN|nr:DUF3592 domain-containing protein [Streptomyces ureilyticus]NGO46018.1 DUF3592 domain-containing protein [Streptomyces ureilyticus]